MRTNHPIDARTRVLLTLFCLSFITIGLALAQGGTDFSGKVLMVDAAAGKLRHERGGWNQVYFCGQRQDAIRWSGAEEP